MTQQHGNSDGKILPYLARIAPKSGAKSMFFAPKCEHTSIMDRSAGVPVRLRFLLLIGK